MPTEHDDDNHDQIETVTAPASTTTLGSQFDGSKTHVEKPTDHPDRPVKPTSTSPADTPSAEEASATATAPSSWIDKFPAFGGSKTATLWVAGSGVVIAVFCIGLGVYLCIARKRQRRNNPRNNYEFELLDEEEGDGLNNGEKGAQGRRTRGGELYDAFAGASDDEEDFDEYRDRSAERLADNANEEDQYVIGEESDDEDGHGRAAETKPLGRGSRS